MAVTIDGTSGINTPGVVNTAAETIATTLAVTGVTTFAAGTAALPAITTTGDTNTGIFFPAADTIAFAEGGAEAMRITSAGNVGIGTSSPLNFTNYTTLTLNNASAGGVYAINNNGTNVAQFYGDGSAVALFGLTAIPMTFSTNSTERARIDSSGNVLIGTTSTTGNGKFTNALDSATIAKSANGITFSSIQSSATSNNATVDVFRFLDAAGNLNGTGRVAGYIYLASIGASGGNAFCAVYTLLTTSNGTSTATFTAVSTQVRGTSPVSSVQIANDGVGGAVKVTITYINNGGVVTGGTSTVSFVGLLA